MVLCSGLSLFAANNHKASYSVRGGAAPKPLQCGSSIEKIKAAGFVIPNCPDGSSSNSPSLLTAQYPASAIFVRVHSPGQALGVRSMIQALKEAKAPVVVNVMGAYEASLAEDLKKEGLLLSNNGKAVQDGRRFSGTMVNLVNGPALDSTFLHDFGKQLVGTAGRWQFFSTRHEGNPEDDAGMTPFGRFLKEKCGISVLSPPPKKEAKSPDQGYGGNFLPIGPKHVITGGKRLGESYQIDPNHASHLQKLSDLGISHTIIDTSFLRAGHVDEIFALVKINRSPPCSLGIVLADSKLGWEHVTGKKAKGADKKPSQKEKRGSFFELGIATAHAAQLVMHGARPESPVQCKFLNLGFLDALRRYEAGLLSKERLYERFFYDRGFVVSINMVGAKEQMLQYEGDEKTFPIYRNLLNADPPKYLEFFQRIADQYCIGFSGLDKTEFKRNGKFDPRLEKLKKLNTETIPRIMAKNEARILKAMKSTGCKDPTVIRIPVLFEETRRGIESLLPNSVNLVPISVHSKTGAQLLVPGSTSVEIDKRITKILEEHGIQPHFSSSESCHILGGNHGCSTGVFRVCKPSK